MGRGAGDRGDGSFRKDIGNAVPVAGQRNLGLLELRLHWRHGGDGERAGPRGRPGRRILSGVRLRPTGLHGLESGVAGADGHRGALHPGDDPGPAGTERRAAGPAGRAGTAEPGPGGRIGRAQGGQRRQARRHDRLRHTHTGAGRYRHRGGGPGPQEMSKPLPNSFPLFYNPTDT